MIFYICLALAIIPLMILLPTRVKGRKNIPGKGKMILVCNHQSNLDAVIIASKILKRRFHFMAKSELFKHKLSGAFYKALGMYPVNRKQNDIRAIKTTLGYLNKGKALCIFPEGTRLKTEEVKDIKNGVAMFALKTKSPIVPSFFVNKPRFFGITTYIIGKPFNLSEMEEFKDKPITKDILNRASEVISEKMNEIKEGYEESKTKKHKKKEKKVKKKDA